MSLDKHEVIERLCMLASDVGSKHFDNDFAHDCFCGLAKGPFQNCGASNYRFDETVIVFIEEAVKAAINSKYEEE